MLGFGVFPSDSALLSTALDEVVSGIPSDAQERAKLLRTGNLLSAAIDKRRKCRRSARGCACFYEHPRTLSRWPGTPLSDHRVRLRGRDRHRTLLRCRGPLA